MKIREGLTFDDVLLVPKYSEIKSRSKVNTQVSLGKDVTLDIPIISANMKTITGADMAKTLSRLGGLPILHRFFESTDDYINEFKKATENSNKVGASLGIQEHDKELASKLYDNGCRIMCVDVAHADNKYVIEMTEYLSSVFPDVLLISGNVATAGGARRLYEAGADVIKLNIGNGSLCTTRIETGNGVPTLTAIADINDWRFNSRSSVKLICDGGIRTAGDIVKALCFTDCVMIGSLLAGTDETPGEVTTYRVSSGLMSYKEYAGSSTHKANHIEGVSVRVECIGPAENVITRLMEGVRSGLSYQGCFDLDEIKESPEFIRVTNAGLRENHPHKNR